MCARLGSLLAFSLPVLVCIACSPGADASAPPTGDDDMPVDPRFAEHEGADDERSAGARDGDLVAERETDRAHARLEAAAPPRPAQTIFRRELERATHGGRPPYLIQQLGPEAHRPGGRFIGWKITRVWPDDPDLCAPGCDLRPGDVVVAVNGMPLQYPEELSDLMAKLEHIETLKVQMLRNGKLRKVEYDIVDQ